MATLEDNLVDELDPRNQASSSNRTNRHLDRDLVIHQDGRFVWTGRYLAFVRLTEYWQSERG